MMKSDDCLSVPDCSWEALKLCTSEDNTCQCGGQKVNIFLALPGSAVASEGIDLPRCNQSETLKVKNEFRRMAFP